MERKKSAKCVGQLQFALIRPYFVLDSTTFLSRSHVIQTIKLRLVKHLASTVAELAF